MSAESDGAVVKLTMEGDYTPSDYFEEAVAIERPGHTIALSDGKAVVTLKRIEPIPTIEERKSIIREVEWLLKSRRVLSGRPYEFTGLAFTVHRSDGRRNIFVTAETHLKVGASMAAFSVFQNPGDTIIADPRAEQLARDRAFLERSLKHWGDAVLEKLTASFGQAVSDPADMFVHLYEIRDALAKEFGSETEARQKLGIGKQEWRAFGKIANTEPVAESRHRGQHDSLRPATEDERNQAMAFGRKLIEKYLDYRDQNP